MKYLFTTVLFVFALLQAIFAQHSEPSEIQAYRIIEKVNLDGVLDENFWQEIPHISNFTQRELDYGKPVSEKTEVAVAYNKNNLYVGIWCYQKDASKITAKFMFPDFFYEFDDNFQIMVSPFDDNRTGYLFVINPNGARADLLITGVEDGNMDWNGVWDAKTTVTDSGWFAEVVIPFSTMQFKKDSVLNWALNFERDIAAKNEQALWQGWSRDSYIFAVVRAGRLTGLKDISYAKRFELKPYVLAGRHSDDINGVSYPLKAGGDLNVYLSPTLKLNFTSFTDFAQVESDRIPVNLSRFSVYYPEKRQYFLEGSNFYSYYLGDRNFAFYSRQIGIQDGQQVPIVAGARLFGKIGKNNIGFLNIQEGAVDSIPWANNTVFRYKREIWKQSYIGGIFTNVTNATHTSQVIGIDANYVSSEFLKDKNIDISAKLTTSLEDFKHQDSTVTYRLSIDYPNDLIDNFMAIGSMQKNFNPELGYVRRSNYNSYSWFFRIMPRWLTKYGIKRFLFKPWGFTVYQTQSTGELESFSNETRPLGAVLKSGERFEINFIQDFDRIDEPFALTDSVVIDTGKYMMYKNELQFQTYTGRRYWLFALFNWGEFYTGKIKTLELEFGFNVNKHFNINNVYSRNWLNMPQETFVTNEFATYWNFAFTTKMIFSLFAQYNDLDNIMIYNIRLHWIPKVGSDLYFVYNIGYDEPIRQVDYLKPQTTDAVMKIVYRFVF